MLLCNEEAEHKVSHYKMSIKLSFGNQTRTLAGKQCKLWMEEVMLKGSGSKPRWRCASGDEPEPSAWAGAQRACLDRESWGDCMKGLFTKHDQDSRKPSPVQYLTAGRSEGQQTPLGLKGPRQWLETGQRNHKERALWREPALDRQMQPTHSEKPGGKQGMNCHLTLLLPSYLLLLPQENQKNWREDKGAINI